MRPAFSALWNLDLAFADVISTSSEPRLGEIRLAWWREQLEDLDGEHRGPPEPRLREIASKLLPRGVSGGELSQLEDAWLPLLEPFPWSNLQAEGLRLRGRLLFGIGSRLLGNDDNPAKRAGELWSLVDGAQHCSDEPSRRFLLKEAVKIDLSGRAARRLRPLTILAAVAASDVLKPSNHLARGITATCHRLTGAYPRFQKRRSALARSD